jgi:hypothetical protein
MMAMPLPGYAQATATIANDPSGSRLMVARKIAAITVPSGYLSDVYDAIIPQMMEASVRAQIGNADYDAHKDEDDFKERLRRSSSIVSAELALIVGPYEAKLREAYAMAYARQFDEPSLTEILAFYGTPVGGQFAQRTLALVSDPAVVTLQREIAPAATNALPAIMEKVKAATADLPPLIKPKANNE